MSLERSRRHFEAYIKGARCPPLNQKGMMVLKLKKPCTVFYFLCVTASHTAGLTSPGADCRLMVKVVVALYLASAVTVPFASLL